MNVSVIQKRWKQFLSNFDQFWAIFRYINFFLIGFFHNSNDTSIKYYIELWPE